MFELPILELFQFYTVNDLVGMCKVKKAGNDNNFAIIN